jgi:thiamine-monophosphate kinase
MEADLFAWLRSRLPTHPRVRLGLGDDAAVLDVAGLGECVLTVDMLSEGVDFDLRAVSARRVGHKALAVNLSDLAAMAARPLAAVVAVTLPRQNGLSLAQELYEGMCPLAQRHDLPIAGGDTNSWDGPLVICLTLLGAVTERGPLRRSGAQPGDRIIVTGFFGGSILGRHLDFEPRVAEALLLNQRYDLHAGIDVSDGLAIDLARLAAESNCGAVLWPQRVPIAPAAYQLAELHGDGQTPLAHALGDGEDFELLLAVPPEQAARMLAEQPLAVPLAEIGYFTAQPGLWSEDAAGARQPLAPTGWQHQFT